MHPTRAFKLLTDDQFAALGRDEFAGAPVDVADGYVHLSTDDQVAETAATYFTGVDPLWLVEVDLAATDGEVRWEPARGRDLFPHLYGTLRPGASRRWWRLTLAPDGTPRLPPQ